MEQDSNKHRQKKQLEHQMQEHQYILLDGSMNWGSMNWKIGDHQS